MAVRNLNCIFRPRHVAVIGASDAPGRLGQTVLRNLISSGLAAEVYPVNPHRQSVLSLRAYPTLAALPVVPDLAVVCTPAATIAGLVRECGELGVGGMIVFAAGFRETGDAGRALEQQVREEAARFDGLRMIGPNCLGVIVPGMGLNASFAAGMPAPGKIAFISQSGALCTSVLDWALEQQIGFSHFVSIGNMLDVGFADLLDYLAADDQTEAAVLYVESIRNAREFMSAARAFARHKPIVACKSGRFAESASAAASHTGALAGVDAVYEAAFQRAGIERVFNVEDIFDCANLLARQPLPVGPRLAIVTNAGGPGVLATDALIEGGGRLAKLADSTLADLNAQLPPYWSHGNPIDVLGDAPPERFATAVRLALADPGVDAVLVVLTPQAMTNPTATAEALVPFARTPQKPILAAWMGGRAVAAGEQVLRLAGVPAYPFPEPAVRAFLHLASYGRNRELLYETPRDRPLAFDHDRAKLQALRDAVLVGKTGILGEEPSKLLLAAYGVPVAAPVAAYSAAEAEQAAIRAGFPVVLKILSPDITHKTDVGGVVLNLKNGAEVRQAFDRIAASVKAHRPDARIDGVTVQPMISAASGVELILGARQDPVFGAVILIGIGGVTAELLQDRALGLPPFNERLARRMLESLRTWPLLSGYRGRPGVDLDRLIDVLMRFSFLIADCPEILEMDVNPLLATADGLIALDARVVAGVSPLAHEKFPFAHLAIRPYPGEFTRKAVLKDGAAITLRPIKPEDEPLWQELLNNCSARSLWFRFRHLFKNTSHEVAARYCYLDYDRELALVAEIESAGQRRLLGVGRLAADADHQNAEYAVLVADEFQEKGLGNLLTEACLDIARRWGVRELYGETTIDNPRMIALFKRHGFELTSPGDLQSIVARKSL